MNKTIKNSFLWALVFWITLFGVVYAANIITVTTQTISTWDSIWAGWYQSVNDKVLSLESTKADTSVTNNMYTKTQVDALISNLRDELSITIWSVSSEPWLSCKDILDKWWNTWDGLYWIKPTWSSSAFEAYCDMTTDDWGWTLAVIVRPDQWHRNENRVLNPIDPNSTTASKLSDAEINWLNASVVRAQSLRNVFTRYFKVTGTWSAIWKTPAYNQGWVSYNNYKNWTLDNSCNFTGSYGLNSDWPKWFSSHAHNSDWCHWSSPYLIYTRWVTGNISNWWWGSWFYDNSWSTHRAWYGRVRFR